MSYSAIPAEDIGSYPVLVQDLKGLLAHVEAADPDLQTPRYDAVLSLALLGIQFVKSRNNNMVNPQSIQSMMRQFSVKAPDTADYVVLLTPDGLRRCPLVGTEQPETPAPDEMAIEEMANDEQFDNSALDQQTDEEKDPVQEAFDSDLPRTQRKKKR